MRSKRGVLYCTFTIAKALKHRRESSGTLPFSESDGLALLADMCTSSNPKTRNIALRGMRDIVVMASLEQPEWERACRAAVGVFLSPQCDLYARIESGSVVSTEYSWKKVFGEKWREGSR